MTPKIAVVLPVKNGMPHLTAAVESVLRQTLSDFEFLIVDDGSTDDTPRYCLSIHDHRVRYFRLNGAGLVQALNFGLRAARAAVIARMDADDISHSMRLAKQLDLMRRESLVLLSCQFDRINATGVVTGRTSNLLSDSAIRWRLLFTPAFVHPGAMFDKTAALRIGGYCSEFHVAQDFDLWTRLAMCGRLGNHPEVLLQYRTLASSTSATNGESQISNAAVAASRYAASIVPGLQEREWHALHRFSTTGQISSTHSLLRIARKFAEVRSYFRSRFGTSDDELNESIAAFELHLRWLTLKLGDNRGALDRFYAYRAARVFDPNRTGIASIVRRRFSARRKPASDKVKRKFGPDTTQPVALLPK